MKEFCCRLGPEETRDSSVGNPWQKDPQKSVFPLGGDSAVIITRGNLNLAFKLAVVDLHGNDSHWFARCGKG